MAKTIKEQVMGVIDNILPKGTKVPYTEITVPDDYMLRGGTIAGGGAIGGGLLYEWLKPEPPVQLVTPQMMQQYPSPGNMPGQGVMIDESTGQAVPVGVPVLSEEDIASQINYLGKRVATDMATLKQLQEMQMALGVPAQ